MKKIIGIFVIIMIVGTMFAGCGLEEGVSETLHYSTGFNDVLFEDIIVEDIIVEDIIVEDIIVEDIVIESN